MTTGSTQILYGAEGIKQAYEMTLKAETLDVVCLSKNYTDVIGKYFDADYGPRLFKSKIRTREVLPDTDGNRNDAEKKDGRKNQVRFIELSKKSESDYILTEERLIFVSYNKKMPYALIVDDADLVANLKNQFDSLWERL